MPSKKQIYEILSELDKMSNERLKRQLDLKKQRRAIDRLVSFSDECPACELYLHNLKHLLMQFADPAGTQNRKALRAYNRRVNEITAHMLKQHHLIPEGYFLSIYMTFGISIGVLLGLTVFDNLALGLPLGTCVGVAIGAGLDADAKKKQRTI